MVTKILYFWQKAKHLWWLLVIEKNTLTMPIICCKMYLVIQLHRLKLYFWWQIKYLWWVLVIEKYINDGLSSSQNIFGRPTSSYEVVFSTTNQVFMMTFSHRKNTLTTTLVHHKMYLVVQLPHMKKYFRQKISIAHDGFLRSKMSVSDGLVSNIVLPTRLLPTEVDGLLPSTLLICDSFLCCCDEL